MGADKLRKESSAEFQEVLSHMLQPDPARRWSAEQVLMHPWVRGPEVGEAEMAAALQKMSRHAVGAPLPLDPSQHRVRGC